MRASDQDRDRAMEVLRAAARDGRLTPDELAERLAAVLSSRTHSELTMLTADLAARPGPTQIRIDQRGGSLRRTGRWVVPERLELRSSWCDVWLDFTVAVITHDTLRIDLNMRGGSLILAAGPSLVVDADALTVRCADVNIHPATTDLAAPSRLRVHLTGRMRYGWIGQR
jgi:Domain of unknown function (DUF1707)